MNLQRGANYLEISLNSPPHLRPCYVPGDTISGEIIIHGPEQIHGIHASITLKCVARVHFKESGRIFSPDHTHEIVLLHWQKRILARKKHPGHIAWAFSFSMPSNVQLACSSRWSSSAGDSSFASNRGHLLPPSLSKYLDEGLIPNLAEEPLDGVVSIVYTLKATLTKPYFSHPYSGPTNREREIIFSPLRQEEPQCNPQVTSSTHSLSPYNLTSNVRDHDSAHAQRLYWTTMKPTVTLHISIPTVVASGQVLGIKLSFEHNISQVLIKKLPPLILNTISIYVSAETYARVPGGLRRDPQTGWEHAYSIGHLKDSDEADRAIMLTDANTKRWDVNSLLKELNERSIDIPTFKTYNIARSWTLEVQGELKLADQKMPFDVKKPLVVLPRYNREEVLREIRSNEIATASLSSNNIEREDGAPPPYSLHEGNAPSSSTTAEGIGLPSYHTALNEK